MRLAVDILHPAHVHFFRNFIAEMEARGHDFLITARDKECTLDLLAAHRIPHRALSRHRHGGPALALELLHRTFAFWRLARRFRPDFLLGIMGPTIALAGKLLPAKTVIFYDTEMAKATNWFAYPLADRVVTPECYQGTIGRHQVRYPGYHELAYLHPRRFTPDRRRIEALGLAAGRPLFVVRFVSWGASHDVGERGFSLAGKRLLVERLAARGRVVISSEGPLPEDLDRYRLSLPVEDVHHVLAHAQLLVGEVRPGTLLRPPAIAGGPGAGG